MDGRTRTIAHFGTFLARAYLHTRMGQKTQEAAYLDIRDVERMERLEQYTKSGFIREAVKEKLDRVDGNE